MVVSQSYLAGQTKMLLTSLRSLAGVGRSVSALASTPLHRNVHASNPGRTGALAIKVPFRHFCRIRMAVTHQQAAYNICVLLVYAQYRLAC